MNSVKGIGRIPEMVAADPSSAADIEIDATDIEQRWKTGAPQIVRG